MTSTKIQAECRFLSGIFKAMDDSGDGLLSEEEMSEWLMDERSLDGDRDSRLSRIASK